MARALARGWGEPVLASDGGSGRAAALAAELGGEAFSSNAEVAERADLVVLCHKPAQLHEVSEEIAGRAKAVVSVLAATSLTMLREAYRKTPVFIAVPNTAVEVRRGVTVFAQLEPGAVEERLKQQVLELFGRVGRVVELPEKTMGAATSVTGVGPAYQALLVEAQVDAAIRHGLPARLAAEVVVETMAGAAALLEARDYDTLTVRREVTSPGGTTARGLEALERHGVRSAFQAAIDAVRYGGRGGAGGGAR